MENRIVMEPAAKIREMARTALAGKWKQMTLGILIYYIFSTVIGQLLDCFFYSTEVVDVMGETMEMNMGYASGIYEFTVGGALTCGLAMFLLAFFRTKTIDYALTFEGFSMFGKSFVLYLLYSVKIALWALLFIVPGVIAAYRYSQCFYLRVDNPDWTASQCINESKRLMKGNKAKLFGLELSFIGWMILASLPEILIDFTSLTSYAYVIVSAILAIPSLFVMLYQQLSSTIFYELVTGNLVIVPESFGQKYQNYDVNQNMYTEETKDENRDDL